MGNHTARTLHFNPRSPHGERPRLTSAGRGTGRFQSTLPARGATQASRAGVPKSAISIHAPRTGSDEVGGENVTVHDDFNPRSPHGERLLPGATVRRLPKISIHAPRTGSDDAQPACGGQRHDFNPRSPHGERLYVGSHSAAYSAFQSTLPARGATPWT